VFFLVLLYSKSEKVDGCKLFGTALGLAGVGAVIGLDAINGLGAAVGGQLAILAGAFLYACAVLYGKGFSSIPPTVTAAGTMVWATVFLVPASVLIDHPWSLSPTSSSIAAALVLGLFSTGVALLIYFRLVTTMGAMGVASQSYLRAGISVLLGIAFLGESMTLGIGIGLAAVVAGVAVINLPRPRMLGNPH
jgi:drug/metabolite transporter (DMT)-like permease